MKTDEEDRKFATLVDAIRPALPQVVIIGGWACRLFRLLPDSVGPEHDPLLTDDTDVAVPSRGLRGLDLRSRLKKYGFTEDPTGEYTPPITHYKLGDDGGFYAEFLSPLAGGEFRRDGTPDVTERLGNVIAQKLRFLEILLVSPWEVTIGESAGFPLAEPAVVQIPNPVTFIVQKLLINSRRHPHDQAKDLLYIHDTIELFGGALDELNRLWRETVSPTMHLNHVELARSEADRLFGRVNDLIREAALLAPDRLSAESLQIFAAHGLSQLLALD